jgi:hypothetical protein
MNRLKIGGQGAADSRDERAEPRLNPWSEGSDLCTLHANSSAEVFNKIALLAAQAPERLEFRHAFALANTV